jgi:hypothetical protein
MIDVSTTIHQDAMTELSLPIRCDCSDCDCSDCDCSDCDCGDGGCGC